MYLRNDEGKEIGVRRNVPLCSKVATSNWKAEQMLHALISKTLELRQKTSPSMVPDETVTFRCFVEMRCLPIQGDTRSLAYRKINTLRIKHYLVQHFGRIPLNQIGHPGSEPDSTIWPQSLGSRSPSPRGSPRTRPHPPGC